MDTSEQIKIRTAKPWLAAKEESAGEMIEGTVKKMFRRETEFGVYPVVMLDTGTDRYTAVHAFHSLLITPMKEAKVKPGDKLSIIYLGKAESKNKNAKGEPRTYHDYVVIVNGEDASTQDFDGWDNVDEPGF